MEKEHKYIQKKRLLTLALAAALILALGISAYAVGEVVLSRIFGWGGNAEIVQSIDENGETISVTMLHTDDLTEPVEISDGRMYFIVNDERLDITEELGQGESFSYEYTDAEGNTHYWLIGLNSDELENYGYAEYIKGADGLWVGGYSARTSPDENGDDLEWLEIGKEELNIPW